MIKLRKNAIKRIKEYSVTHYDLQSKINVVKDAVDENDHKYAKMKIVIACF